MHSMPLSMFLYFDLLDFPVFSYLLHKIEIMNVYLQ